MAMSMKLSGWKATCVLCVVFVAIASSAQKFTTVGIFNGNNGAYPYYVSLVQGRDGDLYGTTGGGGLELYGTVFKLSLNGKLSVLHVFNFGDGSLPNAGLVLGRDGNFYGTTVYGGTSDYGTAFKISPSGTLTTLHSFAYLDGANPVNVLVEATDGNFYGTTSRGGAGNSCFDGCGTIFRMNATGAVTTIYNFAGNDGGYPVAALVEGVDGLLYGATQVGGANGYGTLFSITTGGVLTTVHDFDYIDGSGTSNALIQATDGSFYGTTPGGGAFGSGTIFKLTSSSQLTTLYSFCSQPNCADGSDPVSGLRRATDGNFYGSTMSGGDNGKGTLFRITPAGRLTTLYRFHAIDGANPYVGPVQATNGIFYGTTWLGGGVNDGTIYSLDLGLSAFVEPSPSFGEPGGRVSILGTNLSGTSSVTFNGIPATFTVASSTLLNATVPPGATTGPVQVVTPSGTLTSNTVFRVR